MHKFKQTKKLPFKPKDLYNIVLNVEAYPEFLPWCESVRVISKSEFEIIADMVVQFKGFSEKYTSRIIFNDGVNISVEAISGPFKYLHNSWNFIEVDDGTKIEFIIDFEFKSILLDKLMGLFFSRATSKMIEAFENRARNIFSN